MEKPSRPSPPPPPPPPPSGKSRPDCVNSSNPYHECSDYCLRKIVEAMERLERAVQEPPAPASVVAAKSDAAPAQADDDDADAETDNDEEDAAADDDGYLKMTVTENQKLVFELRVRPSTILRFVVAVVCALLGIHLLGVSLVVVAHALI
uniref:Uncharacterized protein n=1 Tax=Oryza punctata TaxID=4537 RepID=A0A0E0LFJ2_ORYPU